MSENRNVVEMHGCIVCAKVFHVLAVYTPANELVGFTVTSPGGRPLPGERQPLVVCDTHSADDIGRALKKWQNRNSDTEEEQDDA